MANCAKQYAVSVIRNASVKNFILSPWVWHDAGAVESYGVVVTKYRYLNWI